MNKYPQIQAIPQVVNTKEKNFIALQKKQMFIVTVVLLPIWLLQTSNLTAVYLWLFAIGFILLIEPALTGNTSNGQPINANKQSKELSDMIYGIGPRGNTLMKNH